MRALLAVLLGLATLVVSAMYVWYTAFGTYAPYDDEGYFQAALALVRNGARPYDDVVVPYGPAWLAARELVHGALQVPLTTDGVRLATIASWLAAAGLCAWITARCTRASESRAPVAIAAFAFAALVLHTLANEPGHPQDVALGCTLLALLAALGPRGVTRSVSTAVSGAAWALAALTKVNVGLFGGLALTAHAARAGVWRVLILAAGLALPWLLMRARLDELEVVALGLASNVAWGTAHTSARTTSTDPAPMDVRVFAGAALACVLAVVAWLTTSGTSVGALVDAVLVAPLRFTSEIARSIEIPAYGALAAVLSLAAWFVDRRTLHLRGTAALLAFGVSAIGIALVSPGAALALVLPWTWIALDGTRSRSLVVFTAALFPLQAFPVSGTQLSLGVVPLVVLGVVVLGDAAAGIVSARVRVALPWFAAVCALAVVALSASAARDVYFARDALPLAGAERTRFDEAWGARQACLAATLRASEAAFVSVRGGDHSLHAWSGRLPPSRVLQSHAFGVLSPEQQTRIVEDCRAAARLFVLDQPGRWNDAERARVPLLAYSDSELVAGGRLRTDVLRHRRGEEAPRWASCALLAAPDALELELRLPAGVTLGRVKRAVVIDAEQGTVLFDTASREHGLRVDIGRGALVLAHALPRERAAFTCVRLFDANGARTVTLQLVLAQGD